MNSQFWADTPKGTPSGVPQASPPQTVILSGGAKRRSEGSRYFAVALTSVLALTAGCKRQPYSPPRPANVSSTAVYLQGPDGKGNWQDCQYVDGQDRCCIWTVGGTLLHDAVYATYPDARSVQQSALKIAQQGNETVVKLQNGLFLIPAHGEAHDSAMRYLDFMTGKTDSFDSASPKSQPTTHN